MFRTVCATFSIYGASVARGLGKVKAEEPQDPMIIGEGKRTFTEEIRGNIKVTSVYGADPNKPWMAEPLTDEATRNLNKDSMRTKMELMIMKVQKDFCMGLESQENPKFRFQVDRWNRVEGGGGITCVLQDGETFEKAGVNISVVHGEIPPSAVAQMNSRGKKLPEGKNMPFFACGISSVIHPRNPHVPTIHFNYRYFEVEENPGQIRWWFGGGIDLTPYYLDEKDIVQFHKHLKSVCDQHDKKFYPKFKAWCDDYFRIKHRNISRGIGGIFFDDFDKGDPDKCFNFVKDCANAVTSLYVPLVKKHRKRTYGNAEREWQLIRRGHYAEFNLVYDRGTKFGLYTPGARYESILMSLPLTAKWEYMHTIHPGSNEEKLVKVLKDPKDWAEMN